MADPPLINSTWLIERPGKELAIAAFRRQRDFWVYFTSQNISIGEEYRCGPRVKTDAQILTYIQKNLGPVWHVFWEIEELGAGKTIMLLWREHEHHDRIAHLPQYCANDDLATPLNPTTFLSVNRQGLHGFSILVHESRVWNLNYEDKYRRWKSLPLITMSTTSIQVLDLKTRTNEEFESIVDITRINIANPLAHGRELS